MNLDHNHASPGRFIEQSLYSFGHSQSASLAHGTQNIYYASPPPTSTQAHVTISPPLGRLSQQRPLRGRENLISKIQQSSTDNKVTGVHVIYGLAGSGKTTLALEIASQASALGVAVWWIAANDASSLAMGMRSLCSRIGVSEIELAHTNHADALWRRLSQFEQQWLLVLDNVDNPALLSDSSQSFTDGTGWIRPNVGSNGGVLITTRIATPSAWGSWCSMHQTMMLSDSDGADMLLDYVPASAGTTDDARLLSTRLGGLPLAIRLAGLYLADTARQPWPEPNSICTINAYHRAIDAGLIPDIESRDFFSRAWSLSLKLLNERGFRFARHLLYLVSMFGESAIPFRVLLDPPTMGQKAPFEGIDSISLWRTINALADFGMVDLVGFSPAQDSPEYLRVHPVVRDITRIGTPPDAHESSYLSLSVSLVEHALEHRDLGEPRDTKTWKAWSELAPHALALTRTALSIGPAAPAIETLAPAWCSFQDYLMSRGMQRDAEDLARLAIAVSEQHLGKQDATTLHARGHLATILEERSKYKEAKACFSVILRDAEKAFGPDSIEFFAIRHNYADFLAERGEYVHSERILRSVLLFEVNQLGELHDNTLLTKACLAKTLREKGDLKAAITCYEEVLEARTTLLGLTHRSTLSTRHNYAHALADSGQVEEAEEIHREILDFELSQSGADSPPVFNIRHCLAHLLSRRGKLEQATAELSIAFEGRLRSYGERHPATLELRKCMASLLETRRKPEAARIELVTVIEMLEETLGAEHAQTLRARHGLAHATSKMGDLIGAQRAFLDLYAIQRKVLGTKHPYTRETKECLDAEKKLSSGRPGHFPIHGGGKSSGRKKGRKKR